LAASALAIAILALPTFLRARLRKENGPRRDNS
jgi:hypothetical protein